MIAWMVRALLVSGVAAAAAYCFERALHNRGLATRFAWLFGIAASLLVPFIPRVHSAPDISAVIPAVPLPVLEVTAAAPPAQAAGTLPILLLVWLTLSFVALMVYAIAYVRLRQARRNWQRASLAECEVLVSREYGPAVCGFRRPRIVVPGWVFDITMLEQRLIVQHETEHIRARDQLLVLAALAATIVMPWNPFVWLQIHRMRFAVEADCDQRVLKAAGNREQYASLLLDVGRRNSGLLLAPALAEQRNGLEKRITILAANAVRRRWTALGFACAGALLFVISCESRLPTAPAPTPRGNDQTETTAATRERTGEWVLGEREYPPLLRAAGVGGIVGLRVHVTDGGIADRAAVTSSSGHDALDQAAVAAAKHAEWANEGPARHTDYWTTTSVTFRPDAGMRPMQSDTPPPSISRNPVFTPYTTAPTLLNREEVALALMRTYPPQLRDARVGGQVLVWALLDETGRVFKSQVKQGSGHAELDQAALTVTEIMKFSPAMNRDAPVAAWIQLPIVFKTDGGAAPAPARKSDQALIGPELPARPTITSDTTMPVLQNRADIAHALVEDYPPALRKAGVGGAVLVSVLVDEHGDVKNVHLKSGSGHAELDDAALRVARTMKFSPGLDRGKAVAMWIRIPILFKTK